MNKNDLEQKIIKDIAELIGFSGSVLPTSLKNSDSKKAYLALLEDQKLIDILQDKDKQEAITAALINNELQYFEDYSSKVIARNNREDKFKEDYEIFKNELYEIADKFVIEVEAFEKDKGFKCDLHQVRSLKWLLENTLPKYVTPDQ